MTPSKRRAFARLHSLKTMRRLVKKVKKVVKRRKVVDNTPFVGWTVYKVLHPSTQGYGKGTQILTGGNTSMDWTPYLPTKDGLPGKPCELSRKRPLSLCVYGLHVTSKPRNWSVTKAGARLFVAKVFGPTKGGLRYDDKICAYKVQLVREVKRQTLQTNPEWTKAITP